MIKSLVCVCLYMRVQFSLYACKRVFSYVSSRSCYEIEVVALIGMNNIQTVTTIVSDLQSEKEKFVELNQIFNNCNLPHIPGLYIHMCYQWRYICVCFPFLVEWYWCPMKYFHMNTIHPRGHNVIIIKDSSTIMRRWNVLL